ncbi:hypothetical protein AB0B45_15275 [Nonomuraea sp. NPDC049152]|uniref:hypothetical protein n=1 Tax=Nonomuraea sp. NPDC049152 TaxID=3154350 RepID=UPI0034072C5F
MGLDIVVGNLANLDDDGEAIEHFGEEFAAVARALRVAGFGDWRQPEADLGEPVEFQSWGYGGLHYLRRLAVHLTASGILPPPGDDRASKDPLLAEAYRRGPAYAIDIEKKATVGSADEGRTGFDHLVQHSDAEGYYVPVDFQPVLIDERITGAYLGSSHRLLDECLRLARVLELPDDLDPESDEVWEIAGGGITDSGRRWHRYGIEAFVCLRLIAAARASIRVGAAIIFT